MWYIIAKSLIFASFILSITGCKIKVKMQSQTEKAFQIQIYVPSIKMMSERVTIKNKDDYRTVLIKGKNCDKEQWIIQTWKDVNNKWVPAKETKAKFEGIGSFGISIKDDLLPRITNRFAVLCSEGSC